MGRLRELGGSSGLVWGAAMYASADLFRMLKEGKIVKIEYQTWDATDWVFCIATIYSFANGIFSKSYFGLGHNCATGAVALFLWYNKRLFHVGEKLEQSAHTYEEHNTAHAQHNARQETLNQVVAELLELERKRLETLFDKTEDQANELSDRIRELQGVRDALEQQIEGFKDERLKLAAAVRNATRALTQQPSNPHAAKGRPTSPSEQIEGLVSEGQ